MWMKSERGMSLVETAVSLGLLGIISVAFLGALSTSSSSMLIADEYSTARILAESQMESIKKQSYSFSYDPVPIPENYPGYSSLVDIDNMRNGNIQKITITVRHRNKDITTLESYKTNR